MQQTRLWWGVVWAMPGWSAVGGAALGFLYGPIVEVILLIIRIVEDTANHVPDASKFDVGALFTVMFVNCFVGLAVGALSGFVGGTIAGVVIAVVLALRDRRPNDTQTIFRSLSAMSAFIGGLVIWVVMTGFNFQSNLAYMGGDWIGKGWFFYVVVPAILMAGVFWRISSVVISRSVLTTQVV